MPGEKRHATPLPDYEIDRQNRQERRKEGPGGDVLKIQIGDQDPNESDHEKKPKRRDERGVAIVDFTV